MGADCAEFVIVLCVQVLGQTLSHGTGLPQGEPELSAHLRFHSPWLCGASVVCAAPPSGVEVCVVCSVWVQTCLLYTSPSPRDLSTSRMPSSA